MRSDLGVREVRTGRDLARFVDLPYRLYRGDPCWAPPLRRDVRRQLSAGRNPFFAHGEVACFLAERGGRAAARAAAIVNRAHNEFHGDGTGFFGFFESREDAEAARAVLESCAQWLRARGMQAMRGPTSLSTNDECGLLVEGFQHRPTLLTPHNPPGYATLLEASGLAKVKDMYLYQHLVTALPERLVRGAHLVIRRQGVTLRALRKERMREDLGLLRGLYSSGWERNWGFVPMSEQEIDAMAAELTPIVEPELVVFIERAGETLAFAAAIPDMNEALRKNPGGRLFPGILRVLWAARSIRRVRILLLGIRPDVQGLGLDAPMFEWIWRKAGELGYEWGEAGWVLEDNAAMNNALLRFGFERYKTLRLFERAL